MAGPSSKVRATLITASSEAVAGPGVQANRIGIHPTMENKHSFYDFPSRDTLWDYATHLIYRAQGVAVMTLVND